MASAVSTQRRFINRRNAGGEDSKTLAKDDLDPVRINAARHRAWRDGSDQLCDCDVIDIGSKIDAHGKFSGLAGALIHESQIARK
jgi:hypothetical protein